MIAPMDDFSSPLLFFLFSAAAKYMSIFYDWGYGAHHIIKRVIDAISNHAGHQKDL